jgi:hypothetical protein
VVVKSIELEVLAYILVTDNYIEVIGKGRVMSHVQTVQTDGSIHFRSDLFYIFVLVASVYSTIYLFIYLFMCF